MTINTSFGLFRIEPFRWLRRIWAWIDSPEESKVRRYSPVEQSDVQIRSMTDGEILIRGESEVSPTLRSWYVYEAKRRALKTSKLFLTALRAAYPDKAKMALAETLFRPEA